jgi:3',5'-cyclic AMP phosphodiesterase CpdA
MYMNSNISRRDFLAMSGVGGLVLASGLPGCAGMAGAGDFSFVQITDVHWGYANPKVNPESRSTLPRAIAAVNAMEQKPDFVVFTGDLTQTTDDPKVRRQRLNEVKEMIGGIRGTQVRTFAGEHDASLDRGAAYLEVFGGQLNYTFDHKGVHFIVLDNCSDPAPVLGAKQIEWLKADLARQRPDQPIVVLTHRPLFAMYPQWDWDTRDGAQAIDVLMPFKNVSVFYGHVHHEHHFRTGHIEHHAATSTMFPLAPVGTMPQKTQLPWNTEQPFKGLGFRTVQATASGTAAQPREIPLARG